MNKPIETGFESIGSVEMLEAIEAWFEYWDDHYGGEPMKDYEIKMLNVLRKTGRHV